MKKLLLLITGILILFSSCEKFLSEKSDKSYAIPSTLGDLQAMLDHSQVMIVRDGPAAEISNIDTYLLDADLNARSQDERNMYTWRRANIFPELDEWYFNYSITYKANSALSFLEEIERTPGNSQQWDFIKGQAYFFRAKYYLKGLYVFAPAYDENTANTDLGVVLREGVDFNIPSVRSTVEEGYQQVISDFKNAIRYLPINSMYTTRPSKPAAYAMLARTYWSMRKYNEALLYADSSLRIKQDLLDFNSLTASAAYPVPMNNIEVLNESFAATSFLNNSRAKLNPELVSLYEDNDLRKAVFLKDNGNGTFGFKGSYEGGSSMFSGIATDEVLLIRAECYARTNKLTEALADLNALLKKRYKTNTHVDRTSTDQQTVLNMILTERRKELALRGLRWIDVKRLNKEGAGIEFNRTLNGVNYKITPNSNGFVLPIPEAVITLTGMPQNP